MDEYRLKDFFKVYVSKGGSLDKREYKAVMQTFLDLALKNILNGKPLVMGYHLGRLSIVRHPRMFNKKVVNWGDSNKYKAKLISEGKKLYDKETKEGYEWLIYYTDPYYYKFRWAKPIYPNAGYKPITKNIQFYNFRPFARTQDKLSESINEMSPLIHELVVWNIT